MHFLRFVLCLQSGLRLLLAILGAAGVGGLTAAEFHVAPGGSDANPGTRARPFQSLEAARNAARGLLLDRKGRPDRMTIWLHEGDYPRLKALELTAADSGTPEAPVVWSALKGVHARLLGGRVLHRFGPIMDPDILSRLDAGAREHVVQTDLRSEGLTDWGHLSSRGFARPVTPAHSELFFSGKPMTLARWPNEGAWEKITGFPSTTGQGDEHGGKIGALPAGFQYGGDRPSRWKDTGDLWVHGYWAWDWANSYEQVASLDPAGHLVKTTPPHGNYGFRTGQRFHFLNVFEELDQPGEWYLDRKSGVLYFWPPAPIDSGEVLLSLSEEPLLRLTGASNIVIQGLTLEATRATGITIAQGSNTRISGCTIRNVGNEGVSIQGGTRHTVAACDILDTGDGGVSLSGGDRQTLTPGDHLVDNCRFERQARWSKCYAPAILMNGVGLRASHNLIQEHPHCAILFNGNDHVIEFNEIHHIALETGDVGAIYTGRDYTYRGNRIRYNFIHHTGGVGMGSMGVYMDDCVSGTEILGNIFYKVHWAAFLGGGRDHRVENNVFVECDPAVRVDGRGLDRSPVWHNMVYDTMRKNLAAVPQELYRKRYPDIIALDPLYAVDKGIPPENNRVVHNVCVGKWLEVGWHANTNWLEVRDNFISGDPLFVAPDRMDFRLRKESPAWKTGFQAIPVDKIGLQPTPFRKSVPQPGR
jgi:hypothetical protein